MVLAFDPRLFSLGTRRRGDLVIALSVTTELGPVMAGLIAGRVGAAMAAELGTMRVTIRSTLTRYRPIR